MARKPEAISPRQRQSQQIMREKKAKKRREELKRKFQFIGGAIGGALFVGICGFSWYSGAFSKTIENVSNAAYGATAKSGLAVRSLHIEGRARTPMNEITHALAVKKNDPILRLSLAEMQQRLQEIPSIREAAVERALPDALYVRIVEREPVALWQNQGDLSLVDDKGVIMQGIDISPYRNLPLIVGDGAPAHVMELMDILSNTPEIAADFASAIRVGDRRWNIRLDDGVEVKLPEQNAGKALANLMQMNKEEKILERDIRVIDLRAPDKIFIKLSPEVLSPRIEGAKET